MTETSNSVAAAELFTPEFGSDPYPTYAALREEAPVCPVRSPRFDSYLITRYDDARAALTDPRLSKDLYGTGGAYRKIFGENSAAINKNMLNSDPPEHTRLRRLVSQAFTPRRIEAMTTRVIDTVDGLVDAMAPAGRAELMAEFALPLPVTVICDLLGIPEEDRAAFVRCTRVIRASGTAGRSPDEDRAAVQEAQQQAHECLTHLVARKREQPGEDLISALIAARDVDGRLSERELVSTAFLLLFAGHQTTSDFIGNAVMALLSHPEQLQLLLGRPELLPSAIEELLRFDGPVPVASPRVATEDVEYQGVRIPRGAIVTIVVNAANHDPRHFADPEWLDLTRIHNPHVAFGHGVHYCLGVSLARMEANVAIGTLLCRLPDLDLAVAPTEIRRLPAASPFRGLLELPVRFTPQPLGPRT
jgi:cytochrome P450